MLTRFRVHFRSSLRHQADSGDLVKPISLPALGASGRLAKEPRKWLTWGVAERALGWLANHRELVCWRARRLAGWLAKSRPSAGY